ncbi:hypothetical protein [Pseudonocardia sp. HH130629-09]|uniref:hypothetical protein n=1 Tax=Pseudonocardia sp. HH130629-09 TaxID=1641402 RepID=UPI0006CB767F|nr:hypothetical protein [Pseudonocardia sp. HH130629-09]ALE83577.1 hypothetical protein XF36_10765 [Pseudonocardia sp. HH130629-09]
MTTPAAATTGEATAGDATAERILAAPATDDAFDSGAALDGLLGCVGMSGADAGGCLYVVVKPRRGPDRVR